MGAGQSVPFWSKACFCALRLTVPSFSLTCRAATSSDTTQLFARVEEETGWRKEELGKRYAQVGGQANPTGPKVETMTEQRLRFFTYQKYRAM